MKKEKTMENKQDELKIMPRAATPRSVRRGKNMIAVASGKGGVGKTWFSITLAHALSGYKQKTLLFDGDLGLANIDIQLGLMVKDDLGSVIAGSKTLNQVIHHCDRTRFDIIAGRSGSAGLASMLDVTQARVVYYSTRATLPGLESLIHNTINSLSVLLGTYPEICMHVWKRWSRCPTTGLLCL